LAIDSIASARRVLNWFWDHGSGCGLLGHAGVFQTEKEILVRGFLRQVGVEDQWVLEHVFLKVYAKNVVGLDLGQIFRTLDNLVTGRWESLFFKEKWVHKLTKLI
jgi:hypothetical protein